MTSETDNRTVKDTVAPTWVMVTHPEEGTVHCICCSAVTDPQEYGEGIQEHKPSCNAVALITAIEMQYAALKRLHAIGDNHGRPCVPCNAAEFAALALRHGGL